jgi:hypothetical protein
MVATVAAGIAAACDDDRDRDVIEGSGVVATETRDVTDFQAVTLDGIGHLIVVPGPLPALTIEAEDNLLPLFMSEVAGQRLTVELDADGRSVRPHKPITIRVTVPELADVVFSGSGEVDVAAFTADRFSVTLAGLGDIRVAGLATHHFTAELSGSGNLRVAGEATVQQISMSGAGNYDAERLVSADAAVTISGAGNATVRVSQALNATISGAGNVTYIGEPQVETHVTGVGTVTRRVGD